MELSAAEFTFSPTREDDLDLIRSWLVRPHVRRWYDDVAAETFPDHSIAERRSAIRGEDPTDYFLIRLDGRPIGEIQSYRIDDDPEYAAMVAIGRPAVGIDVFIGEPELIGHGHGPALIRAFLHDIGFPRYGVDRASSGPPAATSPRYARTRRRASAFSRCTSSLSRANRSITSWSSHARSWMQARCS